MDGSRIVYRQSSVVAKTVAVFRPEAPADL